MKDSKLIRIQRFLNSKSMMLSSKKNQLQAAQAALVSSVNSGYETAVQSVIHYSNKARTLEAEIRILESDIDFLIELLESE